MRLHVFQTPGRIACQVRLQVRLFVAGHGLVNRMFFVCWLSLSLPPVY
jgi:hypothetical protein